MPCSGFHSGFWILNTGLRLSHTGLLICGMLLAVPASAAALGGKVIELRANGLVVRAAIELTDPFPEKLRPALEQGGRLYLRVEAELWEDRPVWDRLVKPATVAAFRISRARDGREVSVADVTGGLATYPDYPNPLVVQLDVSPLDRIVETARYYVNGTATIGTLGDRDIADAGEAVFGADDGTVGLKSAGRFLLGAVLRITDYVQSVSASLRSGKVSGREIRIR
jgi:hypothetical protein